MQVWRCLTARCDFNFLDSWNLESGAQGIVTKWSSNWSAGLFFDATAAARRPPSIWRGLGASIGRPDSRRLSEVPLGFSKFQKGFNKVLVGFSLCL